MANIPSVKLSNDIAMPQFGLGVWQAKDGQEVESAVTTALQAGYRLIDTAAIYGNEAGVGRAIKQSGIPREEIFLTTKVWNDDQGFDTTLLAFERSLQKLDTDYIDLYLIHWPMPNAGKFVDTWKALEKLYIDKKVRAIGVCNFKPAHLDTLLAEAEIVPMVNQIELHPRLQQYETRNFSAEHNIQVESYSPLMQARELLTNNMITSIAKAHDKTPAQVVLRWHVQQGLVVIPKSVTPERITENMQIFDFELTGEDMKKIEAMNTDTRIGADPDHF